MSRTWKDRPSIVQSNDPMNRRKVYEHHFCGPRWIALKSHKVEKEFDLGWGRTFVAKRTIVTLWGIKYVECTMGGNNYYSDCGLTPFDRADWHFNYSKTRKDDRKNYNKRIGAIEKNISKRLVDEYNACGIIEEDYIYPSHKPERGWWN